MLQTTVVAKTLRNQAKQPELNPRNRSFIGQERMSCKLIKKDLLKIITYMTKGKFDPVYIKNDQFIYDGHPVNLAHRKSQWVIQKVDSSPVQLYEQFVRERGQLVKNDVNGHPRMPETVYTELIKQARLFVLDDLIGAWTPYAQNIYKMLIGTYAHKNAILLDTHARQFLRFA